MAKSKSPKPETKPDDKDQRETCFIMMPFHEPFFFFCHAIFAPAADDAGLRITRSDDDFTSREIVADMWKKIREAKICLAVLSEANANVFYELGLADALSKPVVLVSDKEESIPFDLRAYRTAFYDTNQRDWWKSLQDVVTLFLLETQANPLEATPVMFREQVEASPPTENELTSRLGEMDRSIRLLKESLLSGSTAWKTTGTPITFSPLATVQMRLTDLMGYAPKTWTPTEDKLMQPAIALLREGHNRNSIIGALVGYVDLDTAIKVLKAADQQLLAQQAMALKPDTTEPTEKPSDSDA